MPSCHAEHLNFQENRPAVRTEAYSRISDYLKTKTANVYFAQNSWTVLLYNVYNNDRGYVFSSDTTAKQELHKTQYVFQEAQIRE